MLVGEPKKPNFTEKQAKIQELLDKLTRKKLKKMMRKNLLKLFGGMMGNILQFHMFQKLIKFDGFVFLIGKVNFNLLRSLLSNLDLL